MFVSSPCNPYKTKNLVLDSGFKYPSFSKDSDMDLIRSVPANITYFGCCFPLPETLDAHKRNGVG
ncbi:hypothetical protein C5167_026477 [Papaver somniferum]|nr:hypothetical protein C5167_026477 [Papaver somniferum]